MPKTQKTDTRLKEFYNANLKGDLKRDLQLNNVMQVPKLVKIVLNVGVKDAISDSKVLQNVMKVIGVVSGQKAVRTVAKKSIASFKLREGAPIGVKVTLREKTMYEFLDKLINLALPKVRDFQGVPTKLDGQGNYNLGIKEWTIFPEVDYEVSEKIYGLNITFHTNTKNDDHARMLLKGFGMPFRKI